MTKQLLYVVKIVLIFAACLVGIESYAQTHSISGKVIDASGAPIAGASVIVIGNERIYTVTDLDGKFALEVPAGANLNVSFIGYQSQVVAIGNQTTFEITLVEDAEVLEEVVVVGYGVQRKSDVTGSVSSVRAEDLVDRSTSDAANALQGKAAGVQILNLSAAPGSGSLPEGGACPGGPWPAPGPLARTASTGRRWPGRRTGVCPRQTAASPAVG